MRSNATKTASPANMTRPHRVAASANFCSGVFMFISFYLHRLMDKQSVSNLENSESNSPPITTNNAKHRPSPGGKSRNLTDRMFQSNYIWQLAGPITRRNLASLAFVSYFSKAVNETIINKIIFPRAGAETDHRRRRSNLPTGLLGRAL